MERCTRCCMPNTCEGISYDDLGICQGCQSSEYKMHIDREKRDNGMLTTRKLYDPQRSNISILVNKKEKIETPKIQ